MMENSGSNRKDVKEKYRAMTRLFYSVAAEFLEAEVFSGQAVCDRGKSLQVRIVGVPINGITERDDEVEVRDLRWVSC